MPELQEKVRMPEMNGGEWLNGIPLSTSMLRGMPVLVDFWDYTCVNCIRTLPYLREWHRRYEPLGLRVIGVHAPEFSFAREARDVRKAIASFQLTYPVVMDNEYKIMQAFSNHAWPAKYLIDAEGYIRYSHLGERGYHETESMIQKLVREVKPEAPLPPPMDPVRDDDRPGAVCYMATPEVYMGYSRGRFGNPHGVMPDKGYHYRDIGPHAEGYAYLEGTWVVSPEFTAYLDGLEGPGRVMIRYTSKEVNLVMNPLQESPAKVLLLHDGKPLARQEWGADVVADDQGNSVVMVEGPRMYRLVDHSDFGSRELTLVTGSHGLAMYAFTFISCVAPAL